MNANINAQNRSIFYRWLKERRHKLNDLAARHSLIPTDPVLDPARFSWTEDISRHWQEIRAEALAVYRHIDAIPPLRDISPDHRRIAENDEWRSFFLIGYGNEVPENIARAPRTTEFVRQVPGLNSAFYSILGPGVTIPLHRGVSKSHFTAHLGLSIPKDSQNCTMKVDGRDLHWREGEWIVFDDTFEHEVSNKTDEPRIILLCQVSRPLRWPMNWAARLFDLYIRNSPFVTEPKKRIGKWEEAYRAAEQRENA